MYLLIIVFHFNFLLHRLEELEQTSLFNIEEVKMEKSISPIVAVVDPFSTGAILASELCKLNYGVVALYSAKLEQLANVQNLVPQGLSLAFDAVIGFDDNISKIVDSLKSLNRPLVAIFAGAETGVELADQLSELMNLRTNGTALSEARRNKYVMGETIRAAGLRAVKQLRATSWGEIETWIHEWNPEPFKVIVKPMDSAGSDGVTLCLSLDEVRNAFNLIMGKVNGLGIVNKAVLVQEYLEGQEYVIDMVSRDGEHKVAAIWAYDRRAVNGAGFVCFGQRLLTADEPRCRELIDYQKKVISALGIRNGPTHGEVKWFKGEPVLVEVGARCHGAEGQWKIIADYVYGYDQVQMSINAYLNENAFKIAPAEPLTRNSYGRLVFFIVQGEGMLEDIDPDMISEIEHMQSFISMEFFVKKGQYVKKTIDCYTFGGVLRMVHENLNQLLQDYERIREMECTGLFKFE